MQLVTQNVVMKEGVDADYDNSFKLTEDCVQGTRALYNTITEKIRSTYEENKNLVHTDVPEVTSIEIPSLSMTVDLSPLNEERIVKGENAIDFLTKLRAVYKRVRSVQSIAMKDSMLEIKMIEGYTVSVSLKIDSLNHYSIASATVHIRFLLSRRSNLPILASRRRSSIRFSGMTLDCL